MRSDDLLERAARKMFVIAITDDRCLELLNHLLSGGGVTVDPSGHGFVLIPADVAAEMEGMY